MVPRGGAHGANGTGGRCHRPLRRRDTTKARLRHANSARRPYGVACLRKTLASSSNLELERVQQQRHRPCVSYARSWFTDDREWLLVFLAVHSLLAASTRAEPSRVEPGERACVTSLHLDRERILAARRPFKSTASPGITHRINILCLTSEKERCASKEWHAHHRIKESIVYRNIRMYRLWKHDVTDLIR